MKSKYQKFVIIKLLIIFCLTKSTNANAEIFKLSCKNSIVMNKYSKVKTSEWYVHKTKRKVALAKINNSKVKFVSKAWPNNKGYSVSKSKTKIETTMNMNGDVYEVGAGSDNSGNVLIGGMSKAGLNKDKNYVRVKKKLDSLLVEMKQKKQKNQSFKKEEGEYLKLMDEERKIIDQYSIMQECSQPVKVK